MGAGPSQKALDAAVAQANKTGAPAPVAGDGGQTLYYVDGSGAVVPNAVALDRISHAQQAQKAVAQKAAGQKQKGLTPDKAAPKTPLGQKTPEQLAADKAAADQKATIDAANQQYVWLDGHRVKVTAIDPGAGTYSFTTDKDGNKAVQQYSFPTAYNALDNAGSAPASTDQFLMSRSGNIFTGAQANPTAPKTGDHSNAANMLTSSARNMMTIGNGLQWLANLSVKDPGSYAHMVDQLHSAGYMSDSEYAVAGGGYSQQAASAFAQAARDVAVLNSTDPTGAGYTTTLDQLLDSKGKAKAAQDAKNRAANYVPVDRKFTDPTELAAQAKNAAVNAIGRQLTPAEAQALESHYHGLESGMYDQIDAAGKAGAAATVTTPSATGQIDSFLDTHNGQEEADYRAAQYGGALRQLFGLH